MMRIWCLIIFGIIGPSDLVPNGQESNEEAIRIANAYLASIANNEVRQLESSVVNGYYDFLRVVEPSPLFKMTRKMPKGANLQGYLYGLVSYDYLYNVTWESGLMACTNKFGIFRFSYGKRHGFQCESVDVLRQKDYGTDKYIKSHLMITDEQAQNLSESIILTKYKTVESLVSKKIVLQRFILRMLLEQIDDGISYVEFRSSLTFYDSELNLEYNPLQVIELYKEIIQALMMFIPTFIGAKIVFSPYGTDLYNDTKRSIDIVREVSRVHPDLLVGIEFFKPVDLQLLLKLPKTIEVYYHYAKRLNVDDFKKIDRPSSRRVSLSEREIINDHLLKRSGFNITLNHTMVIDVCPTSVYFQQHKVYLRQVVSNFIAAGYRIIICNEYPGFWHITPLSYDWYLVFLFMTKAPENIDFFRRIATNSFVYSSLNTEDKMIAISRWNAEWSQYMKSFVSSS